MSNWPEPTHDESEPPRWGGLGVIGAVVALVVLAVGSSAPSWRLPEFDLPQITLPDFSGPNGSDDSASVALSEAPNLEALSSVTPGEDGSTVQPLAFDECVRTLESMANSLGQDIALAEDTPDRRVGNFKFLDSRLSVICSRSEGTITLRRD